MMTVLLCACCWCVLLADSSWEAPRPHFRILVQEVRTPHMLHLCHTWAEKLEAAAGAPGIFVYHCHSLPARAMSTKWHGSPAVGQMACLIGISAQQESASPANQLFSVPDRRCDAMQAALPLMG